MLTTKSKRPRLSPPPPSSSSQATTATPTPASPGGRGAQDADEKSTTMMRLRQGGCFEVARGWIRSNGGFVHDALALSVPSSTSATDDDDHDVGHGGAIDRYKDREVILTRSVQSGTVLIRIPATTCVVTLETLMRSSHGKILFEIVNDLDDEDLHHPRHDLLLALYLALIYGELERETEDQSGEGDEESFAVKPTRGDKYEGAVKVKRGDNYYEDDDDEAERFLLPYVKTLPPPNSSYYDDLPRRWSDDDRIRLLGGTSLLQRARDDEGGLKRDHALICDAWRRSRRNYCDHSSEAEEARQPPSLELFDSCIAAVSSRAFADLGATSAGRSWSGHRGGGGGDSSDATTLDAMVPILDLLNHKRGGSNEVADVSYRLVHGDGDGGAGGNLHPFVVVTARRNLAAGRPVRNTYGARGNAQLLNGYGFCIPSNVEPDGSSNDVLEFVVPSPPAVVNGGGRGAETTGSATKGSCVVELRAGPKSYTYGGFVRALENFYDRNTEGIGGGGGGMGGLLDGPRTSGGGGEGGARRERNDEDEEEDEDDMEAFLNACDEEEYGENDEGENESEIDEDDDDRHAFHDLMMGSGGEKEEEGKGGASSAQAELVALRNFARALRGKYDGYALRDESLLRALDCALNNDCNGGAGGNNENNHSSSQRRRVHYAALLVSSERRTIRLHLLAIRLIMSKLQAANAPQSKSDPTNKNLECKGRACGVIIDDGEDLTLGPLGVISDGDMIRQQAEDLANAYVKIRHR